MNRLIKITNKLSGITGVISGIVLIGCALMIFINVITRRFFDAPLYGANEIACYLCLAAAAFALPITEWMDGNIKMTLVHEKVSAKTGRVMDLISNIICVPVLAYIAYYFVTQAHSKYIKGDKTVELGMPIFIASTIIAVCLALLAFISCMKLIVRINDMKSGTEFDFRQGQKNEAEEAVSMAGGMSDGVTEEERREDK